MTFLYDDDALWKIANLMNSGQEWNIAMLHEIAEIVRATKKRKVEQPPSPPKA